MASLAQILCAGESLTIGFVAGFTVALLWLIWWGLCGRRGRRGAGLVVLALALASPASAHEPPFTPPPLAQAFKKDLLRVWQVYFQQSQPAAIGFAQVHQESRWKPEARSGVGASGLAQFMPPTAKWIHSLLPADVRAACPSTSGCPLDPRWALQAMVRFDRLLWDAAIWARPDRERQAAMLSAYNGGGRHLTNERAACAEHPDCDPSRYFKNIERYCGARGRAVWACAENKMYPEVILDRWTPLYAKWLGPR